MFLFLLTVVCLRRTTCAINEMKLIVCPTMVEAKFLHAKLNKYLRKALERLQAEANTLCTDKYEEGWSRH